MDTVISPVKKEERVKIGVRSGDTVRVHQKVIEKGKTRIQAFEGVIIAVKHGTEAGGTFTVRTTLSGIGVEKIFPLYSPLIDKIEIVRRSKVRRAKLYFIREKAAKAVRRQLRNAKLMNISTDDFAQEDELENPEESETTPETVPEIEVATETLTEGEPVVEVVSTTETSVEESTNKDDKQSMEQKDEQKESGDEQEKQGALETPEVSETSEGKDVGENKDKEAGAQ